MTKVCEACGQRISYAAKTPPVAHAVPPPERWQVDEGPGTLSVRWRWFTWAAIIMVPFTLFWNGILLGMAAGATEGGAHPERLLIGLVIPHVWVGLGLAYWTLASFVNSTAVTLAGRSVRVSKGPLPWRGNRELAVDEIEQLFVVEKRGSKGKISYELCALKRDRTREVLVDGLESHDRALFLETRLERALGIRDEPVASEVKK